MTSAIESPLKPFFNDARVEVADGVLLHMVINFRTIDRLEGLLGRGMDELLGELATSTSMMAKFIWAMTRDDHPDLGMDHIAGIMFDPVYGPALAATTGDLVRRAFHVGEGPDGGAEGEKRSHPPKRSSGTSRGSSRSGSKRASTRANSGKKRRDRSSSSCAAPPPAN